MQMKLGFYMIEEVKGTFDYHSETGDPTQVGGDVTRKGK